MGFQLHPVGSIRRYDATQSTAVRFASDVMYCSTLSNSVKPVSFQAFVHAGLKPALARTLDHVRGFTPTANTNSAVRAEDHRT
jgi:hypothetical protein